MFKIPLIGQSHKAEKLKELQDAELKKYQDEMSRKLSKWEIENECFVRPVIIDKSSPNSFNLMANILFKRMDNDSMNYYKLFLNQQDDLKNLKTK